MRQPNHIRMELNYHFLREVFIKLNNTYLGDDVICNANHKKKHTNWCVDQVQKSFELRGVNIKVQYAVKSKILTFAKNHFYNKSDKRKAFSDLLNHLGKIFLTPKGEKELLSDINIF